MAFADQLSALLFGARRFAVVAVFVLLPFAAETLAAEAADGSEFGTLKITVDRPGVYSLSFDDLRSFLDGQPLRADGLRLDHRGEAVPLQLDDGGDGEFGPGDALRFVAVRDELWPVKLHDAAQTATLRLDLEGQGSPASGDRAQWAEEQATDDLDTAAPRRRRIFEHDRLRIPLSSPALAQEVGSAWFWTPISHQSSAGFTLEIGALDDRLETDPKLEIHVRVLGWSEAKVPDGTSQHRLEAWLNGHPIGASDWDGRRLNHIVFDELPQEALQPGSQRLELRLPRRLLPDGDPLIDLVYLDRIEVGYRVERLQRGPEPWQVDASDQPVVLLDSDATAGERLATSDGRWIEPDPRGGWVLPPSDRSMQVWITDEEHVRRPIAIERMRPAPGLPDSVDYLMIVPEFLAAGVERLAEAHRRRGLRVAVVLAEAIFDGDGFGEASTEAIRRFLDRAHAQVPDLRFVLLVGDADWFAPPQRDSSDEGSGRGLLPTRTVFTPFGAAASDHFYAADPMAPALPRFALGRLPVASRPELDDVVAKILRHLESKPRPGPATVLLVSDRTAPSLGRTRRSRERLRAEGATLLESARDDGLDLASGLLAALDQAPSVVHFSGHGSRHSWQLGGSHTLGDDTFFDREDVARLSPQRHLPMVVSVSCSTAPFDHPSAGSLGEAMVLSADRGALAFLGASSRLYTVPRFGEIVVRRLLAGETVGDAMTAAKRDLNRDEVSSLYNLLGDPALTLGLE
ncbi:MAG: C25 family cysteine peptidase [Acidobacteriota bacterium]